MKRFSPEHARDVAQRFADSDRAKMWDLFGPDIQRALIDAAIMDEMRIADSADSTIMFTAAQVMQLRGQVEAHLADGVRPKHSRRPLRAFAIDD